MRVRSVDAGRVLAAAALPLLVAGGLTGCGLFPDQVTDCDQRGDAATCLRDERFELAGTSIVVEELETITETGDERDDQARIEAQISLEAEPAGELRAHLHVVDPLIEEAIVIDPDTPPTAGEQTLTWDFSGEGFALRMQTDRFPPDIFLVFDDGDRTVRVNVMSTEYF